MAKKQDDPAKATEAEASGAVIEDSVAKLPDHPAVDSNPREGTTAEMNQQDWNDPGGARRDDDGNVVATARPRRPGDDDYVGQGLDPTPYGKAAK